MQGVRPLPLSKTNGHHLDEAGLVGPPERGVGLYPAEDDDAVRVMSGLVHPHLVPVRKHIHPDRLHTGNDGAAAKLLRNAKTLQNNPLALSGGPAVTAHGGNDEGFRPLCFDKRSKLSQEYRHVCHLTAASGDGHPHPGANPIFHSRQLFTQNGGGVQNAILGEPLPDQTYLGQGRAGQHRPQTGLLLNIHRRSLLIL